jgi:flagellar hook-associated protein 2
VSVRFSGIGSGIDTDAIIQQLLTAEQRPVQLLRQRKDKISVQNNQYKAVSTRASDLRNALTKLTDSSLGAAFDLFQAKKVSSSESSALTASASNEAAAGSYKVDVLRLATATKASSTTPVGQATALSTTLPSISGGAITSGKFSVYINGQAKEITVDKSTDTVQTVLDKVKTQIDSVTGGGTTASVDGSGKISLGYTGGNSVQFGGTGDTSNFAKATYLTTGSANVGNDTFTAQYGTNTLNRTAALTGGSSNFSTAVTAGSVTIGGTQFTIDGTTTLDSLLNKINTDANAGVIASFNANTNKIDLVSKKTGNQAITLGNASDTSNFLSATGLVVGGNSLTSQASTLGLNAQFKINSGATLESTSNAVDSATSGIAGITLNLANTTTTAVSLDVAQDKDKLKAAVADSLNKLNAFVSFVDDQTKKGSILQGETSLVRLRSEIRAQASSSSSASSVYNSLAQIGISTGGVNTNPAQGQVSASFILDDAKFVEALASNPNEVKKLLLGDGGSNKGIFQQLEAKVKSALDPEYGVFASRDKAAGSQIQQINDAVTRTQSRIDKKEKTLRQQFNAMDQAIAKLKNQQSSLSALFR